jgi:hypothetical protein
LTSIRNGDRVARQAGRRRALRARSATAPRRVIRRGFRAKIRRHRASRKARPGGTAARDQTTTQGAAHPAARGRLEPATALPAKAAGPRPPAPMSKTSQLEATVVARVSRRRDRAFAADPFSLAGGVGSVSGGRADERTRNRV